MATRMLDKSRPFGTVHPPLDGMRYEQGGVLFDLDGYPQGYSGQREAAPVASKPPKKPPTQAFSTSTRITDSTDDGGTNGDNENSGDEGKKTVPADAEVDLILWSRGDKKYPFYKVKAAAKALMPEADNTSTETITAALYANGFLRKD